MTFDILIRHGTSMDDRACPGFSGDVATVGDRITAVFGLDNREKF